MNILERVAELHKADAIKLSADLKVVDDFYELIREDLMVTALYEVEKNGCIFGINQLTGLSVLSSRCPVDACSLMLRFSKDQDVAKENLLFIRGFNFAQMERADLLAQTSLESIGLVYTCGIKVEDYGYRSYQRAEIKRIEEKSIGCVDDLHEVLKADSAQDDKYAAIAVLIVVAIIAGYTAYAHFL